LRPRRGICRRVPPRRPPGGGVAPPRWPDRPEGRDVLGPSEPVPRSWRSCARERVDASGHRSPLPRPPSPSPQASLDGCLGVASLLCGVRPSRLSIAWLSLPSPCDTLTVFPMASRIIKDRIDGLSAMPLGERTAAIGADAPPRSQEGWLAFFGGQQPVGRSARRDIDGLRMGRAVAPADSAAPPRRKAIGPLAPKSANRGRGHLAAGGCIRCQKARPACTHGTHFLASSPFSDGRRLLHCRKSHPVCTHGAQL
jgi:hypothetical protein